MRREAQIQQGRIGESAWRWSHQPAGFRAEIRKRKRAENAGGEPHHGIDLVANSLEQGLHQLLADASASNAGCCGEILEVTTLAVRAEHH